MSGHGCIPEKPENINLSDCGMSENLVIKGLSMKKVLPLIVTKPDWAFAPPGPTGLVIVSKIRSQGSLAKEICKY